MIDIEKHTLRRPKGVIEVDRLLDVGAGIRPMQWYVPKEHVCLEPHPEYADVLEAHGYTVHRLPAHRGIAYLSTPKPFDAIYLLDVIEHMDKDVGKSVLKQAMHYATKQVVIYTPHGFLQQNHDPWEMGGDSWQTHRSGWLPEDFPGWKIELLKGSDTRYMRDAIPRYEDYQGIEGFFAIYTK